MQCVLAVFALVAVAVCSVSADGKCARDGFFYNDEKSFTICSNGNSYVQPCAPGTKNSGKYRHGGYAKSAHSFCDVNLVDHGYAVKHGYSHGKGNRGYGHVNKGYGYGNKGYGGYGNKGYGYDKGYGGYGYDNYGYGYDKGYGSHGYGYDNKGYGYGNVGYGYGNKGYGHGYGNSYGHGPRGFRAHVW